MSLTLPRSLRESVIGDLAESYALQARTAGWATATRWYWIESWRTIRSLGALTDEPTHLTSPRGPMQGLLADTRFAWRLFSRRPLITVVALLTLGLGIGMTTTIFSVVRPALLEAIPYPGGDRLVSVWEREADGSTSNVGYPTYLDIAAGARGIESAAAVSYWQPILLGEGEPLRIRGQKVSHRFFTVLGIAPALGRDFQAEDDKPGVGRVAIVSHRLWRDRFGADPGVVGKTVSLDGNPTTIVGVLPERFESLIDPQAEIWSPLRYDLTLPWACRTCRHLRMVAKITPSATAAIVDQEVATVASRLLADFPTEYPGTGAVVEPLRLTITKAARPALLALFGAVALVLILACVNVANLLIGQAVQRHHEFSVRMALGAGRSRLIRQLLIESSSLGLVGSLLGVAIAYGSLELLPLAAQLPRRAAIGVDWGVLGFASLVGVLAGLAFGVGPALVGLESTGPALRDGGRVTLRHRVRRGLIVAEVGLASVLVVGALLLVESMNRLLQVDPGFVPDGLLTMEIQTAGARLATDSASWRYYEAVHAAVGTVPGVGRAALVSQLPLGGGMDGYGIHFESKPGLTPAEEPSADRYAVTADYFETMAIPLVEGRFFTAADRAGAVPVAIVSAGMAAKDFPGKSALGERIKLGDPNGPWRTIVGVVGDVKHHGLDRPQSRQVYLPTEQWLFADYQMTLVARVTGDPDRLATSVRTAVRQVDADPTIEHVASMPTIISESTAGRTLVLRLFQLFAMVALLLSAVGIYGVMSSGVTERLREFGVRSALGASGTALVTTVVGEAAKLSGAGVGLGLVAAAALAPIFRKMLFEVNPIDPAVYGVVGALLLAVAAAAAWVPARRAARSDPASVLRSE